MCDSCCQANVFTIAKELATLLRSLHRKTPSFRCPFLMSAALHCPCVCFKIQHASVKLSKYTNMFTWEGSMCTLLLSILSVERRSNANGKSVEMRLNVKSSLIEKITNSRLKHEYAK